MISDFFFVITSYSIHYTKLYDIRVIGLSAEQSILVESGHKLKLTGPGRKLFVLVGNHRLRKPERAITQLLKAAAIALDRCAA